MKQLTVLYDETCPLCCRAKEWLSEQHAYVPLAFVPAGTTRAQIAFPGLNHEATRNQLTVIGDDGGVYYDERGWLMCLWALRRYRSLALRLASPALLPAARRFVVYVSQHRQALGSFVS